MDVLFNSLSKNTFYIKKNINTKKNKVLPRDSCRAAVCTWRENFPLLISRETSGKQAHTVHGGKVKLTGRKQTEEKPGLQTSTHIHKQCGKIKGSHTNFVNRNEHTEER